MQADQPGEWDGSGFSLCWLARQRPGVAAVSLTFGILALYLGVHALNGTLSVLGQGGAATRIVPVSYTHLTLPTKA